MADKQVAIPAVSTWSADFTKDLIPSAERVALLYHLSYLCLGGISKLERTLRERAVETQMLFGSSEALLLKCVGTSENLVSSLLPSLKVAAENNKPKLAEKFLEKAKAWIDEIINEVKDIVSRYENHNRDVAKSTSEINTEKEEIDKNKKRLTAEMAAIQKIVDSLNANLAKITKDLADNDKKIDQKNAEIQSYIGKITNKTSEVPSKAGGNAGAAAAGVGHPAIAVVSMIIPFVETIIGFVTQMVTSADQRETIKTLQKGLSDLMDVQKRLREQEWDIQNKLMDNQLKLAKLKIDDGQTPDITYLDEVQQCLSRIQQILIQLQKFWQKIRALLDTLKGKTFVGETWIEDLGDMKKYFIDSIDAASEGWKQFGGCCSRAIVIFSLQGHDAYKFLEVNPSSLSKDAWKKEYEGVKLKLEKIKPNLPSEAPALPKN